MSSSSTTDWFLHAVQLCRFHAAGWCKRGETCNFAHSLGSLRPPPSGWPHARTHYWRLGDELPDPETQELIDEFIRLEKGELPYWVQQLKERTKPKPPDHPPPGTSKPKRTARPRPPDHPPPKELHQPQATTSPPWKQPKGRGVPQDVQSREQAPRPKKMPRLATMADEGKTADVEAKDEIMEEENVAQAEEGEVAQAEEEEKKEAEEEEVEEYEEEYEEQEEAEVAQAEEAKEEEKEVAMKKEDGVEVEKDVQVKEEVEEEEEAVAEDEQQVTEDAANVALKLKWLRSILGWQQQQQAEEEEDRLPGFIAAGSLVAKDCRIEVALGQWSTVKNE